jgi:outer membrane protein assembly factor BamD (BamD/ComL family)
MKLGKKPGLNYREGVKLCREVMQTYPGSEYADEAQRLLREVPERERAQYGITDEELGL